MIEGLIHHIEYVGLSPVITTQEAQKDLISQALKISSASEEMWLESDQPTVSISCLKCPNLSGSIDPNSVQKTKNELNFKVGNEKFNLRINKVDYFFYVKSNQNIEKNSSVEERHFEIYTSKNREFPSKPSFKSLEEAQSYLKQIIGKKAKQDVSLGSIIEAQNFSEPFIINANDDVKFKYISTSGIQIETQGRAKRSGKKNDVIEVEISTFYKSKISVKGTVIGPGDVVYAAHD